MLLTSGETEREVTLTCGFYMGIHLVTQEQFYAVMGYNPSHFSSNPADGEAQGRRPVEMVNWFHAIAFANRLSIMQGLEPAYHVAGVNWETLTFANVPTTGNATWNAATVNWNASGFRLATEAEWEFAARGGVVCRGNFEFSGSNVVSEVAWYSGNSSGSTQPVGMLRPNALGIYDMSGNVWEWVWDWYGVLPSSGQATNPAGAAAGGNRVFRGGGWINAPVLARSAFRINVVPVNRYINLGFRVVRP